MIALSFPEAAMNRSRRTILAALVLALAACAHPAGAPPAGPAFDASHDFDFEAGAWATHVRRLQRPLSGSAAWVEYEGTTVVHPLLGGRANVAELSIAGAAGRIEGASLRLYEPEARRWTLNYFGVADGKLTAPLAGGFRDGVGRFFGDDTFGGRPIRVRFVITRLAADAYRFEQAFSADGGATWEVNWVATDTRA